MSRLSNFTTYALYAALFLPLVFTSFTFFPWNFGKVIIFQIIVEILVFVWLVRRLHARPLPTLPLKGEGVAIPPLLSRRGREEWSRWSWFHNFTPLDWSILIFLFILIITALTGVNPANSFWGNQARAQGVFTWLHFGAWYFLLKVALDGFCHSDRPSQGVEESRNKVTARSLGCARDDSKVMYLIFLLLTTLVALLVSLTIFFPSILPASLVSGSGGGIVGNRAFAANYLLLAIGIAVYLTATLKGRWRYGLGIAAIILLAALFHLGTRGAQVGLFAGIITVAAGLVWQFARRDRPSIPSFAKEGQSQPPLSSADRRPSEEGERAGRGLASWLAMAAVVFVVVLFISLIIFAQRPEFRQKFPRLADRFNYHQLVSGTGETRLMAWKIAWQGIKEKPFLGWGPENYTIIFNKYYNPQFLKHSFTETVWDKPHNWLLEIGTSAGIVGIISYLGIFVVAGWSILKRRSGESRIVLLATLVAYFVANLFLFETSNSLLLWFLILAFISSQQQESKAVDSETSPPVLSSAEERKNREPSPSQRRGQGEVSHWRLLSLAPFTFLLFILIWKYNIIPLRASYYLSRAHNALDAGVWSDNAVKTLFVPVTFRGENGIFLAERFIQLDKSGLAINSSSTIAVALEAARALDEEFKDHPNNPLPAAWAGQIYMVLGEKVDAKYYVPAENALLQAYKLSPNKQEFLFFLGRLYLLNKNFPAALKAQSKAVAVAPDVNTSHWFYGLTKIASGDVKGGLREIEAAEHLGFAFTADQQLYVLERYAEAKEYATLVSKYQTLIAAEPENVNWYIKLATVYAVMGNKAEARATVAKALQLYPPLKPEADKFIKEYKL